MGNTIYGGCQGKPQIQIIEKKCPNCGADLELFTIDTSITCEKCGFTIYNDTLNCVQWCKYARQCVGDEMYEHYMEILDKQKQRKAEENA